MCSDFCTSSQWQFFFLGASLWIDCIFSALLYLCLHIFLVNVVLASTIGSGLEPSLTSVEQSHQENLKSPIFGHELSRYRVSQCSGSLDLATLCRGILKGEVSCNIHTYRNISTYIVYAIVSVATHVTNKGVGDL